MQLTRFSDYALRVLMHVASQDEEKLSSVAEVADVYGISRNHLMKVVQELGHAGFLETIRGRNGGLRLGRPAGEIRVGEVLRHTEHSFQLVDCGDCLVSPACTLPKMFDEATRAFLAVLDKYTLEDVIKGRKRQLKDLFFAEG
ncbi:MAG: HTH-type transcriptional regulator NsrR [Nitrospirales bacterium]|nr:MAG: HTH-type transcriptional regulator NsrR [Nitrospirales bacterium]